MNPRIKTASLASFIRATLNCYDFCGQWLREDKSHMLSSCFGAPMIQLGYSSDCLDCLNLGIHVIQDRFRPLDFKHVSQHCIIILGEGNSFGKFRIASPRDLSESQSLPRRDTSISINRVGMRSDVGDSIQRFVCVLSVGATTGATKSNV